MFAAAFEACGLNGWSYQRLPVPPELFEQTARALHASGFLGANVTIPHKQAALALAGEASDAARMIGAATTLTFGEGGAVHAQNTDAPGLIAALGRSPRGLSAVVLGAGGSARAAVWALLDAGAEEVAVWNRTPERAATLASGLGARAVPEPPAADILVNCTSVGLQRAASQAAALNQLALTADHVGRYGCVIDLVYASQPTELAAVARERGVAVVDGLDVLVAQGALSFEAWTGLPAPREAMRRGATAA
jgi:shikimate dehydrogenase